MNENMWPTGQRCKYRELRSADHCCVVVNCCVVCIVCFVLFYVLFVRKCVLPPGDNPIAANKYIYHIILAQCLQHLGGQVLT